MAHEIPVIDISEFLAGGSGDAAALEIEKAATEIGFFQVVGHGVPTALLDGVYDAMHALTALDEDTKLRYKSPSGHPYRGVHVRKDDTGAIRQERFLATRYENPQAAIDAGVDPALADFFDPNCWPEGVAGFREACQALFVATQQLAGRIMRLFALALGLGVDGFDDCIEPNSSSFAINHYPARNGPLDGGPPLLFAEHFDGNTLTILHQRGDYEGLQVLRLDAPDQYIAVPVREDAFVINFGELMTHWTNDHWPATRHRVVAPTDPSHERTTLTTFHMPSLSTVVAPLEPWIGEDGPHYEPVTAYQWERQRIKTSYGQKRTDGLSTDAAVVEYASTID